MTNQAQTQAQAQTQDLGLLVWWEFAGVQITPVSMRSLLLAHNRSAAMVKDINPKTARRKAVSQWFVRDSGEHFRAEVASKQPLVAGILKKVKKGSEEVAWEQVEAIHFDSTDSASQEALSFLALCRIRETYLSHDWLRPFIQDELGAFSSFKTRKNGGVYFVAEHDRSRVESLKALVDEVPGATLHFIDIRNSENGRKAIGSECSNHLQGQLKDLMDRINEFKGEANSARLSTMEKTLENLKDLKAESETFAEILNLQVEGIKEQILDAESFMVKAIEEKTTMVVPTTRSTGEDRGYSASTLKRLEAAIASGEKMEDGGIFVSAEAFKAAKLGQRWSRSWFYKPGNPCDRPTRALGFHGVHQASPLGVSFHKLPEDGGDDDRSGVVESGIVLPEMDEVLKMSSSALTTLGDALSIQTESLRKTEKLSAVLSAMMEHKKSELNGLLESLPVGSVVEFAHDGDSPTYERIEGGGWMLSGGEPNEAITTSQLEAGEMGSSWSVSK